MSASLLTEAESSPGRSSPEGRGWGSVPGAARRCGLTLHPVGPGFPEPARVAITRLWDARGVTGNASALTPGPPAAEDAGPCGDLTSGGWWGRSPQRGVGGKLDAAKVSGEVRAPGKGQACGACSAGGLDGGRRTRAARRVLGRTRAQKRPREASGDGGGCPPLSPLLLRLVTERPGTEVAEAAGSAAAETQLSGLGDQHPPPRPCGEPTEPPLGRWGRGSAVERSLRARHDPHGQGPCDRTRRGAGPR